MGTHTEQKTKMHAKRTDVCSSFAAHPENAQLPLVVKFVQFAFVDSSNTELSLDGGDEGRPLEEGTGENLQGTGELCLAAGELFVKSNDADILFSSTLLRFDKTSRAVDTDD